MIKEFFRVLLMLLTSGYDVDLEVSEELERELEYSADIVFENTIDKSLNKQEVLLSGTV